jgi:uncharacterized membrane protein
MRVRPGLAGLMTVASVASVVATVPTAASAAEVTAPCVREQLRLPAGSWQTFGLSDADPSGRFQIAYATDTSWRAHLIRWDNGVPADLGTPPGSLEEINQQGDIVGNADSVDGTYRSTAWRYSGGRLTTLPGLPDSVETVARAIAPDGTVAGWARSADQQTTAVTWAPDNTVRALPGPGGSQAIDIDADGTVIGYLAGAPVRWAPGAEAEILPRYESGPSTSLELTAISAGTVIGTERTGPDARIVEWAPAAAPVSLGTGAAYAINARGSIAYEREYENELWLRQNGVDRSLPFGPSPYSIADIVALTDDDIVYGLHYSAPVRWLCP